MLGALGRRGSSLLEKGKGGVSTVGVGDELIMGPSLNDLASLDHGNDIGVADGGEPVGHYDCGASDHDSVEGLLHAVLRLGVQGAGGLVQEEDGRVLEHGSGYCNPLLLST